MIINTRNLTVAIPAEYCAEAYAILNETWHLMRRTFTAQQGSCLLGKLARLGQATPWVYHLMSHLYTSMAYALRVNKSYLAHASPAYKTTMNNLESKRFSSKDKVSKHVTFALKQMAHQVHHYKREYVINETMHEEI